MVVNATALAADVVTAGQGGGMAVCAAALSCRAKTVIVGVSKAVEKADNIIATVEAASGAIEAAKQGHLVEAAAQLGMAAMSGKASQRCPKKGQ
jgi:hypothetical protein